MTATRPRPAGLFSRRALLLTSGCAAAIAALGTAAAMVPAPRARPVPLADVRLTPSIWADAVEANRRYMLSLNPDRLLHNFRWGAELLPKAPVYAGWEDQSIAGHTLGHYMSALSLMQAQTGDAATRDRLRYVVSELAETQRAHGDGYIGGTTVVRDGRTLDGKLVYEELRRHKISPNSTVLGGFNDGWVPLYTWHKVQAGLVDAVRVAGLDEARPVLVGVSDYLAGVLDVLSDAELQTVLDQEFGGLNESYADVHAITGDPRYLRLAERLRHRAVLDPLAQGRDNLAGLHANTQIPKVIGLARLHELTGDPGNARTARFFHRTVLDNHTYVIGGNSDRAHFGRPGALADRLSDRTCEHCNTYNMLKLTRHLYGWAPDAALFDYYERAHLNHVMASQDPANGAFVYYMPLRTGAKRTHATPVDNFWCCVGSGMESHAKHGDSIYWEDGDTLYVNLFIPSRLDWRERGMALELATGFPYAGTVALAVTRPPRDRLALAIRLPGWAADPALKVNGAAVPIERRGGYALIRRRWRAGDRIELDLPMRIAVEPIPGDPRTVAFTHGPVVLAAGLEGEDGVWHGIAPALLATDAASAVRPVDPAQHRFELAAASGPLALSPFFDQHGGRAAVYFPMLDQPAWAARVQAHTLAEQERRQLDERTVDLLQPMDAEQERAHGLAAHDTEIWSWNGRGMRMAWWTPGSFVEATLKVAPGRNALHALYWGEDVDQDFLVEVDGRLLAREQRRSAPVKQFVAVEYPLPEAMVAGRDRIKVRFTSAGSAASVYELRTVQA